MVSRRRNSAVMIYSKLILCLLSKVILIPTNKNVACYIQCATKRCLVFVFALYVGRCALYNKVISVYDRFNNSITSILRRKIEVKIVHSLLHLSKGKLSY